MISLRKTKREKENGGKAHKRNRPKEEKWDTEKRVDLSSL